MNQSKTPLYRSPEMSRLTVDEFKSVCKNQSTPYRSVRFGQITRLNHCVSRVMERTAHRGSIRSPEDWT